MSPTQGSHEDDDVFNLKTRRKIQSIPYLKAELFIGHMLSFDTFVLVVLEHIDCIRSLGPNPTYPNRSKIRTKKRAEPPSLE